MRAPSRDSLLGKLAAGGGAALYSGGADKTVRVWDALRLKPLRVLSQPAFTVGVSALAAAPSGAGGAGGAGGGAAAGGGCVSGSHDLRLWRGGGLVRARRFRRHPGKLVALDISADGIVCYGGGDVGDIHVVRLPDLETLTTIKVGSAVRALLLDGGILFSGGTDGAVSAWGAISASAAVAAQPDAAAPQAGRPVPPPGWRQQQQQ